MTLTFANSNATVAQLSSDEPSQTAQQSVTKPIQPGTYYTHAVAGGTTYGLTFDPISNGTTTVTVTAPGFLTMTTNGNRTVTVDTPVISAGADQTVGAGLQVSRSASLGASQHGGTDVTISSSAPGLALVSPNATTAGSGSIIVSVPNGSTNVSFVVQGLENVGGTAVVTLSAPGFVSDTFTVTVTPSAIEIQGLPTSIGAAAADDTSWYVQVGIPNAGNTALSQTQNVRAGSPGFVITLTNSAAAVAQLKSDEPVATGQTVTKPIPPGTYYTHNVAAGSTYGLRFDPLAAGSTVVSAMGPAGVISTTQANRTVNVTP